jgi:hypothetical protein
MATQFFPGYTTARKDLNMFLVDSNESPVNAYEITYAIYFVDAGPPEMEVLIGDPNRMPVNPSMGEYWAALMVPPAATGGTYRIRWTFRQYANSPQQTVTQEFTVAADEEATQIQYSSAERAMISKLRVLLRDQNPDKFYHFRPPEHSGRVGNYDRVFGQIWEDAELLCYLETALDYWNSLPPSTESLCSIDRLVNQKPSWRTAVLWGAIVHAMFAVAANWVADEFDYSIGGVSLSIEKSSKYESLKQNAEGQLDKAAEAKVRTTKFIRGLQQPKFGMGIRSAFGPHVGRGVLSPRGFL